VLIPRLRDQRYNTPSTWSEPARTFFINLLAGLGILPCTCSVLRRICRAGARPGLGRRKRRPYSMCNKRRGHRKWVRTSDSSSSYLER